MIPLNVFPMAGIKGRAALFLVSVLTGLSLFACLSGPIPASAVDATQQAYSRAQATLDQGQDDLDDLSYQATVVRQEMAQAAATQKYILEQTQSASIAESIALDQAATEQSASAAATLLAYNMSVTQTAQAQAILDAQAQQTAEAAATQTAFPLTATPWAALQVELAREKTEAARAARWQDYVVTPAKTGLWVVATLFMIYAVVLAYRWLLNVLDPLYRPAALRPLRKLQPPGRNPRPVHDESTRVEIVGPSEPSVVNWIAEAEKQLRVRP